MKKRAKEGRKIWRTLPPLPPDEPGLTKKMSHAAAERIIKKAARECTGDVVTSWSGKVS